MSDLMEGVFKIGINTKKIIENYGEIDSYSQGKHAKQLLGTSARNMGKNDLWIAATASAYGMELIATDKDFNHLNKKYLKLKFIDLELYK